LITTSVSFPQGFMRRLPPLNALRVFDVAARTGSYAAAAAELGLTHGAVSRQIATLESWFGQRLFTRAGRRMAPTPMARMLAEEIGIAFDRIDTAANAFGRLDTRRILRVSAPTSFAMRWLIPRLDRFHTADPNIEVSVMTVSTVHEELRGGFDVAVRRGLPAADAWPRHRAVPVLQESDTLIMSPALHAKRPVRTAADVAAHVLLASETRPGDWIDWLETAGLPHLIDRPRKLFDHFFVTRQAVEDGVGIGIGPLPMLQIDIASGRLMAPLPDIQVRRTGYVALIGQETDAGGPAARFVEWLAAEGKG
jgi:LysR family glycine cleavage system transcriptional activator